MSEANEWDVKLNMKREIPYLQLLTEIFVDYLQGGVKDGRLPKQTVPLISPSSTTEWAVINQPEKSAPHLYAGTHVVGILAPAAPTLKTIPSSNEFFVTKQFTPCLLFCVSIAFTQVWVIMARIGYEEKW